MYTNSIVMEESEPQRPLNRTEAIRPVVARKPQADEAIFKNTLILSAAKDLARI